MGNKLHKYMDVDVIAFLEEKMKSNTKHYQADFEIDKEVFQRYSQSLNPDDKTLLWLSRPMGTQCEREFEAFIKDTGSYNTWQFYAHQTEGPFIAFAVELLDKKDGAIRGNLYELDYLAHADYVAKNAVHCHEVLKSFEDGHVAQTSLRNSSVPYWARFVEEHGPIIESRSIPEDRDRLLTVLAAQKSDRDKMRELPPIRTELVSELTPEDIALDKHLYTCCADKGYSFLVRAKDEADAEKAGSKWYEKSVFEPGHFSCRKTTPQDLSSLDNNLVLETDAFLRSLEQRRKPSLKDQIQSAEAKVGTSKAPVSHQMEAER